MAKPEWGTKQQCPECGTRFYDLNRKPVTCVSCSTSFEPEPLLKPRRQREAPVRKKEEKVVAPVVVAPVVEDDAGDDAGAGGKVSETTDVEVADSGKDADAGDEAKAKADVGDEAKAEAGAGADAGADAGKPLAAGGDGDIPMIDTDLEEDAQP